MTRRRVLPGWLAVFAAALVACDDPVGPQLTVGESCALQPDQNAVVAFEDPVLESEVRAELGVDGAAPLTCRLVGGLTSLSAGGAGITSLKGLHNLTGVRDLLLANNAIGDITPLTDLRALEVIDLQGNQISDLAPLSGLRPIALSLTDNLISDIRPLAPLVGLQLLALDRNEISDIGALAGMTDLLRLVLFENLIQDLSPLAGMGRLDLIDIGQNPRPDLTPLAELGTLTVVGLDGADVVDITALEGLLLLRLVALDNNRNLTDIQPLIANRGFGTRSELWIRDTSVSCTDVQTLSDRGVTVLSDC